MNGPTPAPDVSSEHRALERAAVLVATLASFVTPFMGSSINVALPAIGRDFAIDALALSWIATAYLLTAAVFLVPVGKLADIRGRKATFRNGILVYTSASLACALVPSAGYLIAARAVQGVGAAMMFGTNVAILTSVIPPGRRGTALGINVASVYLGLSLGPFLGGLLTDHFGWRSVFLLNVPLGLLVATVTVWKLKGEWAGDRNQRFDLAGSVLYGLALASLMYGFSRLPAATGAALTAGGAVGLAAFVAWERRVANPVLDVRLFTANRVFAFSNLAALINYSATFAVGFLLSLSLQYVRGMSAQAAGTLLVIQPAFQAAVSPFAGRLSDRVESRIVASGGMALIVVGLALLAALSPRAPTAYLAACLMLLGVGFGLFSSPNTNAVMGSVEPRFYAVASATLGTMRLSGQMVSMGLAMLIFALRLGDVRVTPDHHDAFVGAVRLAFGLFAGLCVVGTFASLARGDARSRSESV